MSKCKKCQYLTPNSDCGLGVKDKEKCKYWKDK